MFNKNNAILSTLEYIEDIKYLFLSLSFLCRLRMLSLDTYTPKFFIRYHRLETPLMKILQTTSSPRQCLKERLSGIHSMLLRNIFH